MDNFDLNVLLDAISGQHWPVVTGMVIVLVVYVANRFGLKDEVGKSLVPWIAASLGIALSIGVQLADGVEWQTALSQGFMAGASAVGLWEMVLKHVLPQAKS